MGKSCGGVRCSEAPERKEKCFFNRDSEGAFGSDSASREGSFWTRISWGKAVAGSGVRKQARRQKEKKSVFLIRIQRGRLAATVRAGEARFRLELAGEKLWRGQVFGRTPKRKEKCFLIGIQRGRLAAKVRSGEARFGSELDGGKLWRDQVCGARMGARKKRKVFF